MAQTKVDDKKVRQIRTHISQDGAQAAANRFGENTPEFRKAAADRKSKLATAGQKQRELHESKGKTMTDQKKTQEKQLTPMQQRARAMKVRQAQQNARIREQKGQSQAQSRGM